MKIKTAVRILTDHNRWRRGDKENEKLEMIHHKLLGEAIDTVINYFAKPDRTIRVLRRMAMSMQAHPDCHPNSEFMDFSTEAYELIETLEGEKSNETDSSPTKTPEPVCPTCLKTQQEAAGNICSSIECNRYRGDDKAREVAEILDGLMYGATIQPRILELMKEQGVVVAWGQSDDLLEIVGPIDDELGCYEGGKFMIFHPQDSHGSGVAMKVTNKNYEGKKNIVEAVWCPEDNDGEVFASWEIKSTIPHHTFDVFEDGELFCRAIAFNVIDLKRLEE